MRKYQPIWNRLKTDLSVSLEAPIWFHKTIIQGVRKEKWRDQGWQMLLLDDGIKYKVKHQIIGRKITFQLVNIAPVSIEEL